MPLLLHLCTQEITLERSCGVRPLLFWVHWVGRSQNTAPEDLEQPKGKKLSVLWNTVAVGGIAAESSVDEVGAPRLVGLVDAELGDSLPLSLCNAQD